MKMNKELKLILLQEKYNIKKPSNKTEDKMAKMGNKNVKCLYCGKDLGGFIFEHNCEKKVNNHEIWDSRKMIGRRGKTKTEKMWN